MQLRAKIRKTFSSRSSRKSGSGGSTPSTEESYTGRTDIEYYKPHEIPKSKYRGRVDKEHQDRLAAFSLADAFATVRRKSSQALSGSFSPGGTKSQSRRTSWISRSSMRTGSITGSDSDTRSLRRRSVAARGAPAETRLRENKIDDDANVGISRTDTVPDHPSQFDGLDIPTLRLEKTVTLRSQHDSPFTVEALEKAMTQATLTPRTFGGRSDAMSVTA